MRNEIRNYDAMYRQSEERKESFYGKPAQVVEQIPYHVFQGEALDIGAGDGRHTIFLAEHGLTVTALDTSSEGIQNIQNIAQKKALHNIKAEVVDITTWTFEKIYDAIVVSMTLQHLQEREALALLERMKEQTAPGGVNAVSLFTNDGDRFLLDREEDPGAFYPANGWLKEYYKGWEIISYEEKKGPLIARTRPDGTPMENTVARMLAKKPV